MPESRVAFYEECLKVMLSRWGKASQRWIEPPLDPTTATAVVQRLAYTLHSADKRDDLPLATLVREAGKRLKELRKPPEQARESIQWLLERSGILREFGVGHLGFFHLGMQEYLAAAYVGEVRGPLLDTVVRALGDSWWHELTRLMVALPSAGMFEALVARLLALDRGWTRHIELIGRWIDESPAAGAAPFIAHLQQQPAPPEEETLAILGILDRFVEDDAVHALAAALSTAKSPAEIKLRAKRLQDRHREQTQQRSTATDLSKNPRARPLALLFREDQRATAEQIAVDLATQGGHELLRGEQGRLEAAETLCGERLYAVCERAAGIVVIANARGAAFVDDPAYADALGVWANEGIQIFGACTSGEIPRWPEDLAGEAALSPWVDLRSGSFMELRIQILRSQDRRGSASGAAVPTLITRGAVFIEPVTEIRFLGVPGGRFRMGQKGVPRAEPVRWVRLSPYWLAETPVTNLQYQRFLEANPKQEKPVFWEDERFAGPSRPVIGVSWEDAVAFCTWLSGQPVLRAANLKALLPSEAQWEFAARSDDERPYPWGKARPNERPFLLGKARPNERLAVFGRKDKGTFTAPVGSCPDGAGPFGHLDLAGNVWEWCRDVWDEQAYVRRQEDALDPVNEQGDPDMRPFRGDCWHSDELWAAAVRSGVRSWFRSNYDGFRVGVEPASR